MKGTWLALATATSLFALPCLAQTDTTGTGTEATTPSTTESTVTTPSAESTTTTTTTPSTTTTTTTTTTAPATVTPPATTTTTTVDTGTTGVTVTGTTGAMSTVGPSGITYTNVDVTKLRSDLNRLRGYLDRIQENDRLSAASADIVHADSFRRNNEILLDNASSLAAQALDELGPPMNIPPGLGEARDHVELVASHLAHARMMTDYSVPIDDAQSHLNDAFAALDRGTAAMAGGNMAGSMGAGSMSGMSGMGTMGTMGNMGTMGTMGTSSTTNNAWNTTEPTKNQSNPGLNNYNRQNNAGTGVGAVTTVPNTTPGMSGTGDTSAGTTTESGTTTP